MTVEALTTLLGDPLTPSEIETSLDVLWRRGLLWRDPEGLRPVSAVLDTLGPYPAGLGPTAASLGADILEPDQLTEAPEAVHAVLGALAWGPPVAQAPPPGSRTASAIEWLIDRNALGQGESGHLTVPRELGLMLRCGRSHRPDQLTMPESVVARTLGRDHVNAAAGSAAAELLAQSDELMAALAGDPWPVLKGGGLGVRELRSLAAGLDSDLRGAAFLIELLVAARLISDDGELEPHFMPTADYDVWRQEPPSRQWARLAWAWWTSIRTLHLLPPSGAGLLGSDLSWPPVRALRQEIVRLLNRAGDRALDTTELESQIRFARPRRLPSDLTTVVSLVVAEAGKLGVTGMGSLSDAGRCLVEAAGVDDLSDAIHPHLPEPVEHVILQGDLTAIAPGPLTGQLAELMRLAADIESRGGATVYRFSPASITRALDRGWTADELVEALVTGSLTPLPQALEYLVRDEARRHGQVRIGAAATYIRTDDPARIAELLSRPELALLRLSQISATVLVSPAEPEVVHGVLRDAGIGGVGETPAGETVRRERRERRASTRKVAPIAHTQLTAEATEDIVRQLRVGESAAQPKAARTPLPHTDPTTALVILREAAAEQTPVWVGYAGASGQIERILFTPEVADGGRVTGTANGVRRTLSIHRITGAAPA